MTLCFCSYKNKGVQVLLDAISAYLPSPFEKSNEALDTAANEAKVVSNGLHFLIHVFR